MHWLISWWMFPLACMVMMVAMFVFMAGMGGLRCMPWVRRTDKRGAPNGTRQSLDESSSFSSSSHTSSVGS